MKAYGLRTSNILPTESIRKKFGGVVRWYVWVCNLVPGKQGALHWRPTAPRLLLLMSLSPIVDLGFRQSPAGGFSRYCSFHGGWGWTGYKLRLHSQILPLTRHSGSSPPWPVEKLPRLNLTRHWAQRAIEDIGLFAMNCREITTVSTKPQLCLNASCYYSRAKYFVGYFLWAPPQCGQFTRTECILKVRQGLCSNLWWLLSKVRAWSIIHQCETSCLISQPCHLIPRDYKGREAGLAGWQRRDLSADDRQSSKGHHQ